MSEDRKIDTSTFAVEQFAKQLDEEARFTEVALAVEDDLTVAYGDQCRLSATLLRALARERDQLKDAPND